VHLIQCIDHITENYSLITTFIQINQAISIPQFHAISKVVQLCCRVRGFKHVMKQFPHEVSHLELCLILLRAQVRIYYAILSCTIQYSAILYCTLLCSALPLSTRIYSKNAQDSVPYCAVLFCTILYTLCYTALYCTILNYLGKACPALPCSETESNFNVVKSYLQCVIVCAVVSCSEYEVLLLYEADLQVIWVYFPSATSERDQQQIF
jgi:hypothetical protein